MQHSNDDTLGSLAMELASLWIVTLRYAKPLQEHVCAVRESIDDLVRWRLHGSYLRYLLSRDHTRTISNRPIQNYYHARWREIHGKGSPSGQIQQGCSGKVGSLVTARKLSITLGKINQYHYGVSRNDIALPRNSVIAIHRGNRWGLARYADAARQPPFLNVETLCQAIIDLGRAANSTGSSDQYTGIQPARCTNHRCHGRHLPMLYHHHSEYLKSCAWCLHHLEIVPFAGTRK